MPHWNRLSDDVLGAISYHLGALSDLKNMATVCRSWRTGPRPDAVARAQFFRSRQWPRVFAAAKPRTQRWSAFVQHRRLVDQRRQQEVAAYQAFHVGAGRSVVASASFLWVCDAAQDKIIRMDEHGIARARLRPDGKAQPQHPPYVDVVYDSHYGCAAVRPRKEPTEVGEAPVVVRLFAAQDGRQMAHTTALYTACCTLVAQHVDADARTAGLLTRTGDTYQLHWVSFVWRDGAADSDSGKNQMIATIFGEWQCVDLDAWFPPEQHLVGFSFSVAQRAVLLVSTSDRGGQIVRMQWPEAGQTQAVTQRCSESSLLEDVQDCQIHWDDHSLMLTDQGQDVLLIDSRTLRVKGSYSKDPDCYHCDQPVSSTTAGSWRLFTCRSQLEFGPWFYGTRFYEDAKVWRVGKLARRPLPELEPEPGATDAMDPMHSDAGRHIAHSKHRMDATDVADAHNAQHLNIETKVERMPGTMEGQNAQQPNMETKNDPTADTQDEFHRANSSSVVCFSPDDQEEQEAEARLAELPSSFVSCKAVPAFRLPDCKHDLVQPQIWVQADWLAVLWPGGFLHVFHYGAPAAACVPLVPHALRMDQMLLKNEEAPHTAVNEHTMEQAASFLTVPTLCALEALQTQPADEMPVVVVDTVVRKCTCYGPPSDGIGVHQLRLLAAAAVVTTTMATPKDAVQSTSLIASPFGTRAVACSDVNASVDHPTTSALDAFSHVIRGPRNRHGNCWMTAVTMLVLTLPRVRHALVSRTDAEWMSDSQHQQHMQREQQELLLSVANLARLMCAANPERRSYLRKKIVRATERVRDAFAQLGFERGRGHVVQDALQALVACLPVPEAKAYRWVPVDHGQPLQQTDTHKGRLMAWISTEVVGTNEQGQDVWHAAVMASDARGLWLFDDTLGHRARNFQGGLLKPGAALAVAEHYVENACVAVYQQDS